MGRYRSLSRIWPRGSSVSSSLQQQGSRNQLQGRERGKRSIKEYGNMLFIESPAEPDSDPIRNTHSEYRLPECDPSRHYSPGSNQYAILHYAPWHEQSY